MRSSPTLAAIAILLSPVWSPTGLLRAQGFLASSAPRVAGPSAGSKTPSAPAAATALGDKVGPLRSNLRGAPAFIENRGQFDRNVRFQLATGGSTLWLTASAITFDTLRPKGAVQRVKARKPPSSLHLPFRSGMSDFERLVVSENFVGANQSPELVPRTPKPGIYSYFIGNEAAKWHTGIKAYAEIVYRNVWDGVDLRLYPKESGLEQEFVLAPGADASKIQVTYNGIESLQVADDGSLLIQTAFGRWRERPPQVYQEISGKRIMISARFKLLGRTSYAFALDSYDKDYSLVLDPTLLFSTYLGGTGSAYGNGIAVDSAGNSYITGYGYLGTFPTTAGVIQQACPAPSPCSTGFVSKFDPVGRLQYSTYLGSTTGSDALLGIAVDRNGDAYTTGLANSGFPTTVGAFPTPCTDGSLFVTELNATATSLLYSTCIGSGDALWGVDGYVAARAIALDPNGRAYITGDTVGGLPITPNALQPAISGYENAFLSIIDPSLAGAASLVYSTFLGGGPNGSFPETTGGRAVAVDAYGNAYLTGVTNSPTFPVTPYAFQRVYPQTNTCFEGGQTLCPTAFVSKINPNISGPTGLVYSSYLGGANAKGGNYGDTGYAIAVDSLGDAFVGGQTPSPNFVTTPGAYQPLPFNSGCLAGFVTKVNPYGSARVYSTFLESNCLETQINAIALDVFGTAFVVGETFDPNGSFPITTDAYQSNNKGSGDAFLTELNSSGSAILYSTFLGGTGQDLATGVAVDAVGDVIVAGTTYSIDFFTTPFANQPTCSSVGTACEDAFVTKFPLGAPGVLSITGIIPNSGGNAGTVSPQISGGGFHAGTTAQLNCGTQVVPGTNVTVGTGGQLLNTTFDVTATAPGSCSVTVTGVDGTSASLSNAFNLTPGGQPNLQLYKVGAPVSKPPLDQPSWSTNATFYVTATNTGTVDLLNASLAEALDSEFSLTAVDPPGAADLSTLTAAGMITWAIPQLAPGQSLQFTYTVTVASDTPVGTTLVGGPACSGTDSFLFYQCLNHYAEQPSCTINTSLECIAEAATCGTSVVSESLSVLWTCPLYVKQCVSCINLNWSEMSGTCLGYTSDPCIRYELQLLGGPSDPNNLSGPRGVASQRWTTGNGALSYVLGFSNDVKATAPAQQVLVTLPLSPNVNMSTFKLVGITIASSTGAPSIHIPIPAGAFNPAAGLNEFTTNVDLRPTQNLFVLVDATLNPSTNTITWTFTSINPKTGQPPTNAGVGFLPPGASASVAIAVVPTAGQATGATVSEQGSVVFANSGISQPPVSTKSWTNTLDNNPPVSHVKALPARSCLDFKVSWSGTDVGSGIQDYAVYVSDNGGPFAAWQTGNPAISATYPGQNGHSYGFYSIARDRVGNLEASKSAAEATTSVATTTSCGGPPSLTGSATVQSLSGATLTLALQITNNGTQTANGIVITKVVPSVLSGAGKVSLTSPNLPITVGDIAPGASAMVTLVLSVPASVTNLGLIEAGTMQDAQAKISSYTLGQEVAP